MCSISQQRHRAAQKQLAQRMQHASLHLLAAKCREQTRLAQMPHASFLCLEKGIKR
jgi:hypothetical protein